MTNAIPRTGASWLVRMAVVSGLVGVGSGVGGIALTLLLRLTQHVAFGYSTGTFAEGVIDANPWHRVSALVLQSRLALRVRTLTK